MRGRTTEALRFFVGLVLGAMTVLVPMGQGQVVEGSTEVVVGTIVSAASAAVTPELQAAQISQKYETAVVLNGQTFYLAANVLLADDAGNPRSWDDFRQDDFVLFHVKTGQVDALILTLPR